MSEKEKTGARANDDATPVLEWITGVIGAVLFAWALTVLIGEALDPNTPPVIGTRVVETREQPDGWLVVFEARNSGDQPAKAVTFVVALSGGERTAVIEREATIDFIGPHSVRRAGVFFSTDPAGREIAIAPQGYLEP